MKFKDYLKEQLKDPDFKKEHERYNLRFETSQLITESRMRLGLSQRELAERVGTRQPSIARIESGASLPSLGFLERIAKAVGASLIAPRFDFVPAETVKMSKTLKMDRRSSVRQKMTHRLAVVKATTKV